VLQADGLEVARERIAGGDGEHGDAVFLAFAAAHGDLVDAEIQVHDAQTQGLEEPQP
jgi:hypothetical protein